jgi:hypothetical protein
VLKQTTQIVVRVDDQQGMVFIEQPDSSGEGDCIIVSPEQIPLLIEWLHEAKAEADELDRTKGRQP